MILKRNDIIKKYPWINKKKQKFIISADYDGLICASLLNHYKNWELVGYYDLESIWISNKAKENKGTTPLWNLKHNNNTAIRQYYNDKTILQR